MARHADFAKQQIDPSFVTKEGLESYFRLCPAWYVRTIRPESFPLHRALYERVRGTEDTAADVSDDTGDSWINIAAANVTPVAFLAKLTRFLLYRGINVARLQSDVISDPSTAVGPQKGTVALIRIQVTSAKAENLPDGVKPFAGSNGDLKSVAWRELLAEISRVRYLDESTIDLGLNRCPGLGLQRAEILDAFCAMVHGPLSKINPHSFPG